MKYVPRGDVKEPETLSTPAVQDAISELQAHFKLPNDLRLTRRPPLHYDLWFNRPVEQHLRTLFHNKCAYCETSIPSEISDIVQHHRPLMNARGGHGTQGMPSADHYAWYAYEWRNLLPVCLPCSRSKSNHFPTRKKRVTPFTPWQDANKTEAPFLLDPCEDHGFRHLTFRSNGYCDGLTPQGSKTIEVLTLNRPALVESRGRLFSNALDLLALLRTGKLNQHGEMLGVFFAPDAEHVGAICNWLGAPLEKFLHRTFETRSYPNAIPKQLVAFTERALSTEWIAYRKAIDQGRGRIGNIEDETSTPGRDAFTTRVATLAQLSARVTRLRIKNFKGIDSISVELSLADSTARGTVPSAVFLGENATGKSSILQALALVLMGSQLRRQVRIEPSRFLQLRPAELTSEDEDEDKDTTVVVEFDTGATNMIRINRAGQLTQDAGPGPLVLAYGAHRIFGHEDTAPLKFRRGASLRSLFHRTQAIPHSSKWLASLGESGFQAVARAMREILALGPLDDIHRNSSGEVMISTHGRKVPLDQVSDGYRALFAMGLDIMRNMVRHWGNLEDARGVVLIDEIEIHLHPRWKMQVVGALRRAMPQVQFIFTTHDPLCLRGMLHGEVHVLVRGERGQVHEMTGLPNVRGMRAEQLLTSEFFGLASTSDPDVARELDELALSAPSGSSKEEVQARRFSSQSSAFMLIGDTPTRQVVNEALRLHIIEQLQSKTLDRAKVRQDAVQQILDRLRAQDRKQPE